MADLHKWIKSYPDFPSKGILFRDISPLLAEPEALKLLKESFTKAIKPLSLNILQELMLEDFYSAL